MNMEESNDVRVKNEPICESQSIPDTKEDKRQPMKVKEEPIDNEMQRSHVEVKAEEKFSATEEFANKTSIAFLNEQTTSDNNPINNQATTSNSQWNKPRNRKTNNLQKSKISSHKKHYKCNTCEKNFTQSGAIERHKRIHTGEKPYECNVCKKSFTLSSILVKHKRIHTGERPFECDVCKRSFTQLSHLERHKRIHTGEKPFECEVCKKRFTDSSNLAKHKRIHSGEKPYECDVCKKRFTTSSNLKKHKTNHNRETS